MESTISVLATGHQIDIRYPDDRDPLVTHTAYGIWYSGYTSYTIADGSGKCWNLTAASWEEVRPI